MRTRALVAIIGAAVAAGSISFAQEQYSWQKPQAKVLPQGDLAWAPEPFVFQVGKDVRYIDFEAGNDANDGTSADKAWKHHPWDRAAQAKAAAGGGDTYVFKRGAIYRGALVAKGGDAIRLTSDPQWGTGDAIISGSEVVRNWKSGGNAAMPEAVKVWQTEVGFAPRRVWVRGSDGKLTRLTLARTPNWKPDNIDDLRSGWYEWEQPEWWTNKNVTTVNGTKMHLGIDKKHLTADPETYKDALVWSEYGIVMGSPFASRVEAYDPQKKGVAFRGPWGGGDDEKIITGNRYFLEDKPQFLDEAGEFWFEQKGNKGTLYVRLPGDVDPNSVQVEAARYATLLDAEKVSDLQVSGLTFQAGNTFYDLTARPFVHKDVESAGIRLLGSAQQVVIDHCRFENLTGGIRIKAEKDSDRINTVRITDNEFADLDRSCIDVKDSSRWGKSDGEFGPLERVEVMRNNIKRIGWRGGRDCHGHTVQIGFADTVEVAGNIIDQVGGAGIFVFGGKGSGEQRDKPLSRVLIHHNKVSDSLLMTNDWGGIETWQGGPHYLWSNISYNPNGFWNWAFKNNANGKPADQVDWGAARQGFAYYFDGSFKNYVFNNIAAGKSNQTGSPLCNASAFQECIGFQNTFFNNTAYNFAVGLRRQAPRAGRDKWLGNIMDSMSVWNFLGAEPKEGAPKDANAFQFSDFKGTNYATETNAYSSNVFRGKPRYFGVFEEDGSAYRDLAAFAKAQQMHKAQAMDVGIQINGPVLADAKQGDYRPADSASLADKGAKVFVPWGLYACVGEWNFVQNQKDPTIAIDEHWYMTKYYVDREKNWATPRHALTGVNITADDYVQGPLDGWAKGAVKLDGKDKYFVAKHADLVKPFEYEVGGKKLTAKGLEIASPEIGAGNLLIETYLRCQPGTERGYIVRKQASDSTAGYSLSIQPNGCPLLMLSSSGAGWGFAAPAIADGKWHHLIAEADRAAGKARIYIDGKIAGEQTIEKLQPADSLENTSDFEVGRNLSGDIEFVRVARGTLKDARTTIEELYAWEFDGPQFRDFTGKKTDGSRFAGAINR